ncbi:MAG: hypothetical protein ACTSVY_08085 [Candidatus Helarchaeota archaeon]
MDSNSKKKSRLNIIKEVKTKKLHEQAKEYLFFQIYIMTEFLNENYGMESVKKFFEFYQESFFNLKMSAFYKLFEGVIKKLPRSLKIKEGLKFFIKEIQFMESVKNIKIIEATNERGVFEVTSCSIKKEFNNLARKSKKLDLIDKCCIWCMESTKYSENYGLKYVIKLTEKGCINIIS